ncbi:hypothetical protein [Pseudomonas sp. NMI1173_11]|uniref:hypothetical protein n=1 Tax=Pseudomonas sp. NMI1173_11 TaxID=2903145 RepID=UPI001E4B4784|nr:hypothetical protein [Pseudomonas sp. NMI1173_11]MCE0999386.1 hypothetical protein [Pseudomonas sp. NMI1173_11]
MVNAKEFPLNKQEAQVLSEAWHSRRASALLDLSGPGLNAGFQEDLVNAARRMGVYQGPPGQYGYGLNAAGMPVLRWTAEPTTEVTKAQ